MFVDINGCRLFFEVYGSKLIPAGANTKEKPTFIFIHGGAGLLDHTPYIKFWSRFADVAEVIFVDMRGSGRSVCYDKSKWNLEQWAKDLKNFCDVLHIENPIVGGISYGGMVAMSYALQFPEHPQALILSDTDVHIDREHMLALVKEKCIERNKSPEKALAVTNQFLDGPLTDELFADYFYEVLTMFGKPVEVIDDFEVFDPTYSNKELGAHFMSGELLSIDMRGAFKDAMFPTLFISGDQGPLHSLKTAQELIASFPEDKIQYHFFEGAKPACYESEPALAEKLVKDFILTLNKKTAS